MIYSNSLPCIVSSLWLSNLQISSLQIKMSFLKIKSFHETIIISKNLFPLESLVYLHNTKFSLYHQSVLLLMHYWKQNKLLFKIRGKWESVLDTCRQVCPKIMPGIINPWTKRQLIKTPFWMRNRCSTPFDLSHPWTTETCTGNENEEANVPAYRFYLCKWALESICSCSKVIKLFREERVIGRRRKYKSRISRFLFRLLRGRRKAWRRQVVAVSSVKVSLADDFKQESCIIWKRR